MARGPKSNPARMVPALDIVQTLQAAQDRAAETARRAGRYPPYDWDLIVLVGKHMGVMLLMVALIVLFSLYQSRQ